MTAGNKRVIWIRWLSPYLRDQSPVTPTTTTTCLLPPLLVIVCCAARDTHVYAHKRNDMSLPAGYKGQAEWLDEISLSHVRRGEERKRKERRGEEERGEEYTLQYCHISRAILSLAPLCVGTVQENNTCAYPPVSLFPVRHWLQDLCFVIQNQTLLAPTVSLFFEPSMKWHNMPFPIWIACFLQVPKIQRHTVSHNHVKQKERLGSA